jgi:hypothetical protein
MPLSIVQENYVNMRPSATGNDDLRRMVRLPDVLFARAHATCMHRRRALTSRVACSTPQELVAQASAAISDGDVLMTTVRRYQARSRQLARLRRYVAT